MNVKSDPDVILVSNPNIIETVYTEEEKQKMKGIIDKILDFHHNRLNMTQMINQGFDEKSVLIIKRIYEILENLSKDERRIRIL
jgi:hypothetical protein